MADLLLTLRGLTAAGSAEYTVNGSAYWTDAQLQDVLDRHVVVVRHEEMYPHGHVDSGGAVSYYEYQSRYRFLETTSAGTSRFIVQDETGATVGTAAWTADYPRGMVTFGTSTDGVSRYLTGYSYDMNAAAADIWSQKASHYVTAYDVGTDNHNLRRSQIITNCLMMKKEYESGARAVSVTVERGDTEV
jgi:hypothetical protein